MLVIHSAEGAGLSGEKPSSHWHLWHLLQPSWAGDNVSIAMFCKYTQRKLSYACFLTVAQRTVHDGQFEQLLLTLLILMAFDGAVRDRMLCLPFACIQSNFPDLCSTTN